MKMCGRRGTRVRRTFLNQDVGGRLGARPALGQQRPRLLRRRGPAAAAASPVQAQLPLRLIPIGTALWP